MIGLQHNLVSLLYAIHGRMAAYFEDEARLDALPEKLRRERAEAVLKKCRTQAFRAVAITKRLGALMKNETMIFPSPEAASTLHIWRRVETELRNRVSLRGSIVLQIPNDFPPVLCRARDLHEVFFQLAQNAFQAMKTNDPQKSKLIVRAEMAFTEKEDCMAVLTIADTGPGISQAILRGLFQPFFTTKPPAEGNGLGLYVVKKLVMNNAGRITVSSFEGRGTTFKIELPLQNPAPSACTENCANV